jgi:cytochrome c556
MLRTLGVVVTAVALLAACGEPEDTRPGQPVKTRQEAFKALLRAYEPMTKMVNYDPEEFAAMTAVLMARRDAPWSHFGPDTNYPPSKAKPRVWQESAAFEQAKNDFLVATDALNAAAQSRDKTRVEEVYGRVYDTCKSCHDNFRGR